jgi:hypothetical protein
MVDQPKPCNSVGIQYGLWIWSNNKYAWVGGTGSGVTPPPPPNPEVWELNDDFNDNVLDTSKWEEVMWSQGNSSGTVQGRETGGAYQEVYTNATYRGLGITSKNGFSFDKAFVEVTVTLVDPLLAARLMVMPTKYGIITEDLLAKSDYYAINLRSTTTPKLTVTRKVEGVATNPYSQSPTVGATCKLRMESDGTNIILKADVGAGWVELLNEANAFLSRTMYLVLYVGGVDGSAVSGTVNFDDFNSASINT